MGNVILLLMSLSVIAGYIGFWGTLIYIVLRFWGVM
jgi:hypothetical protein